MDRSESGVSPCYSYLWADLSSKLMVGTFDLLAFTPPGVLGNASATVLRSNLMNIAWLVLQLCSLTHVHWVAAGRAVASHSFAGISVTGI